MAVKRRSYSRRTSGELPHTPASFTLYLQEQLGILPEVGQWTRFYGQLKREMTAYGWTYVDLIKTVKYVKEKGKQVKTPYEILFYVKEALASQTNQEEYDLVSAVADAVAVETDEAWLRKLSLAKGVALQRVYEMWRNERAQV